MQSSGADKHGPFQQGQCWSSVHQPGLVTLASRLKVSKSPGAAMPEGRSLFFEVSSWDSYTNLFIYKLHISRSQHLQKQCQKMVVWVAILHCYNIAYKVRGSIAQHLRTPSWVQILAWPCDLGQVTFSLCVSRSHLQMEGNRT